MEKALNYKDIILKHNKCIVNSRSECNISTRIANKQISTPVLCSNMPAVLTKDICKLFDNVGWFHIYHRIGGSRDVEEYIQFTNNNKLKFCSISVGVSDEWVEWIKRSCEWDGWAREPDCICIDVALSWQDRVEKVIKYIKNKLPKTYLIVGNGDNPEWIKWLEDLGVDCAKINIGVSRSCRTRQYTGFGSSTITDLIQCKEAGKNIKIMSDGGLTVDENNEVWIGDIAKSIKFGADYVMSGALFKNCLDNPAIKSGYYGNASRKAKGDSHVEGAHLTVETNGLTMKEMIKLIEDSLKSATSYSGGKHVYDIRNTDYQIV